MEYLNIIKKGIKNVVSRREFEKLYKAQGWEIVEEVKPESESVIVTELNTEKKVRNYKKMKTIQDQKFDDNLLKRKE